jgi:hypothetical protein
MLLLGNKQLVFRENGYHSDFVRGTFLFIEVFLVVIDLRERCEAALVETCLGNVLGERQCGTPAESHDHQTCLVLSPGADRSGRFQCVEEMIC